MEQLAPNKVKYKNHGGKQQRRVHNQTQNNNRGWHQQPTQFLSFVSVRSGEPAQRGSTSANKKKTIDIQELVCPKCSRYYQIGGQEFGNYKPFCATCQNQHYGPSNYPYPHQFQQVNTPNNQVRLPYVLPCDHTVCGVCIRAAHAQHAIKCPECDVCAEVDLSQELEKSFAVNYHLVGRITLLRQRSAAPDRMSLVPAGAALVQSRKSGKRQWDTDTTDAIFPGPIMGMQIPNKGPKCLWKSCIFPATISCADCKSMYCTACSADIHRMEGLREHVVRPVEPQLLARCSVHPACVMDFHCVTCAQDYCCYCMMEGGHGGHENRRLTVLLEDQKKEFLDLMASAGEKLQKLQDAFKLADEHIGACAGAPSKHSGSSSGGETAQHQQIAATVDKHFTLLIAKLINMHHRLQQQLELTQNATVASLRAIQAEVAQRMAVGRSLLQQGNQVLGVGDQSKTSLAVYNVVLLKEQLEQMLQWPTCLVDGRKDDDKSASGQIEFISDLSENLDKFCTLKVGDLDQFQLVEEDNIPPGYSLANVVKYPTNLDQGDSSSLSSYHTNISSVTSRQTEDRPFQRPSSALSMTKMPPVKTQEDSIFAPTVGGRIMVSVCHINNPDSIYVQLLDNLNVLKTMHNDLANYIKCMASTEVEDPKEGKIYIVKQNIHWLRALCLKRHSKREDVFIVQLLETGQVAEITKLHMRECNDALRQIPGMAYSCRLNSLFPVEKEWNPLARKLLETILTFKPGYKSPFTPRHKQESNSLQVLMTVIGRRHGCYDVELVATREDSSTVLSYALIFNGLAKQHDTTNEDIDLKMLTRNVQNIKIYNSTTKLELHQRVRVSIVHVEDPQNIYVHLYNFISHIKDLIKNMNTWYLEKNGGFIYTPQLGMYVAVQFIENQNYNWFRGKVVKVIDGVGKVDVLLIDIGKTVTVTYQYLRTLNNTFTMLECQAVHISLADIIPPIMDEYTLVQQSSSSSSTSSNSRWPEQSLEFLREYVDKPGQHLEIAVAAIAARDVSNAGPFQVALFECMSTVHYCINAQLVEAGLALSTGTLSDADNIEWPQDTALPSSDLLAPSRFNATNSHNSNMLLDARSTDSFTLDLIKTAQGNVEEDDQQDDDDDDDEYDESDDPEHRLPRGAGRVEVEVLLVKSPDEIYIKIKSRDSEITNLESSVISDLQLHYNGIVAASALSTLEESPQLTTWKAGENVVAYNVDTRQFHRALIHSADIKTGGYKVLCRDRAIEFTTAGKNIHTPADRFKTTPYFAKRIRLAKIQPMSGSVWPMMATDILRNVFREGAHGASPYKYFYRKAGVPGVIGVGGQLTTPGIMWYCTLVRHGPLVRSRYRYRSMNRELIQYGVAVSTNHNNPYIIRRVPEPIPAPIADNILVKPTPTPASAATTTTSATQLSQAANEPIRMLTPSHTAQAVMRAFQAGLGAELGDSGSGSSASESDTGGAGGKAGASGGEDSSSSLVGGEPGARGGGSSGSGEGEVPSAPGAVRRVKQAFKSPPPPPPPQPHVTTPAPTPAPAPTPTTISAYPLARPFPERRFSACATYVDEAARVYLHPAALAPVLAQLEEKVQQAVRVWQKRIRGIPEVGAGGRVRPGTGANRVYKVGELCTVRYHNDGKWYRGRVNAVLPFNTTGNSGYEYRVQMVDFGNVEQVKPGELCDLVLCPTLPIMSARVRLHQVEPKCGPWNTSILDTIHSMIVAKDVQVQLCDKISNLTPIPDAILRVNSVNINDYLINEFDCLCRGIDVSSITNDDSDSDDVVIVEESEEGVTPSNDSTDVEEVKESLQKMDELTMYPAYKPGDIRTVKVVDVLCINIITIEMLPDNSPELRSKYAKVFDSLNDPNVEHKQLEDIRDTVHCTARFSADSQYYRAEIMFILPTTTTTTTDLDDDLDESSRPLAVQVFFLDYGNCEIVQREHLRSLAPYDPLVRRLPALARMVTLYRVRAPEACTPSRTDGLLHRLAQAVKGKPIDMQVVRHSEKLSVNLIDKQTNKLLYESLIQDGSIVLAEFDSEDED